jgi:class 3 adenylate cyclase
LEFRIVPITKKQALRAIAAQSRKHAGLPFDATALVPERTIDEYLRSPEGVYKRFGEFLKNISIGRGGHPDYDELAKLENLGKTAEGNITTLFMDLKNFTKYCCFLSRRDVYQAKFASIEAAIGVCRLHGGHLHDIPGDGVMFFFGGPRTNDVEAARRALDAAADAMQLLEDVVIAEYNDKSQYPSIHPKIGVDYGMALWGAIGTPPDYEVKATSFNVDIANKMMSQRNSQEVAVGDGLKDLLAIDEEDYLEPGWTYERQMTVKGKVEKFSYKTWVFDWRKHLNDRADSDRDLARMGVVIPPAAAISGSRTRLGDAPLA